MAPVSDLLTVGRRRAADPQEIHQGALLRRTLHRREGFEDTEVRMVAGAVEQLQGTWDRIEIWKYRDLILTYYINIYIYICYIN